ncbi:homoserine O-acetyltransferase [Haemophilus influenzae]|uniref:Homoserine O-acetyltransferase n=1 Tax=Haemophilus influenzae TaxID=727 RepID=A0A2X1PNM3_HAEIF|nr:homoserine O-acetyltransferase [Haemophilus influenzae]
MIQVWGMTMFKEALSRIKARYTLVSVTTDQTF